MTRIVRIAAEPLTEVSFKPFGQVIGEHDRPPDYQGPKGTARWNLDFQGGRAHVSYIRTPYQGLAFTMLERHLRLSQTFIPLGGGPAVVAVAAPTALDDREAIARPDDVHAFVIDGSKGYVLAPGTWHSLDRFPLAPPDSRFVMITDHETANDLEDARAGHGRFTQEVDYAARFGVRFEIEVRAPAGHRGAAG